MQPLVKLIDPTFNVSNESQKDIEGFAFQIAIQFLRTYFFQYHYNAKLLHKTYRLEVHGLADSWDSDKSQCLWLGTPEPQHS